MLQMHFSGPPFSENSLFQMVHLKSPVFDLQYSTHLNLADACMKSFKTKVDKLCEVEQVSVPSLE